MHSFKIGTLSMHTPTLRIGRYCPVIFWQIKLTICEFHITSLARCHGDTQQRTAFPIYNYGWESLTYVSFSVTSYCTNEVASILFNERKKTTEARHYDGALCWAAYMRHKTSQQDWDRIPPPSLLSSHK